MCFPKISPEFSKKQKRHLQKEDYGSLRILSTFSNFIRATNGKAGSNTFRRFIDCYVCACRTSGLLDLIDHWWTALDNKCYVAALFMDLSKCVDLHAARPPDIQVGRLQTNITCVGNI